MEPRQSTTVPKTSKTSALRRFSWESTQTQRGLRSKETAHLIVGARASAAAIRAPRCAIPVAEAKRRSVAARRRRPTGCTMIAFFPPACRGCRSEKSRAAGTPGTASVLSRMRLESAGRMISLRPWPPMRRPRALAHPLREAHCSPVIHVCPTARCIPRVCDAPA